MAFRGGYSASFAHLNLKAIELLSFGCLGQRRLVLSGKMANAWVQAGEEREMADE